MDTEDFNTVCKKLSEIKLLRKRIETLEKFIYDIKITAKEIIMHAQCFSKYPEPPHSVLGAYSISL